MSQRNFKNITCFRFISYQFNYAQDMCMSIPPTFILVIYSYMVVSWNGCTPKSSIWIGFSTTNNPFLGTSTYGTHHICAKKSMCCAEAQTLRSWLPTAATGRTPCCASVRGLELGQRVFQPVSLGMSGFFWGKKTKSQWYHKHVKCNKTLWTPHVSLFEWP